MDLQQVKEAAQSMIEHIEAHDERADVPLLLAQCELMRLRLKVIKKERRPVLELVKG